MADRSSAAASPGRRILSRITSPFATKSRSITDFYIQPDDPHRQYSPGDLVTGSVRLRVLRPTRVTHVVVSLHGYAQVFKNPGSPGEGFRATPGYLGTGRGKKSAEYFGNGFASLFEDELVLCGDGRLAEGAYQFNFELEFPDTDLPSSIDVSISPVVMKDPQTDVALVRARYCFLHDYSNCDQTYNNIADIVV